ncbi:hypothetical protein EDC65_3967 [Stella humosa]|uniref:Uncharacterized protein n=1 Tax=Stella humosa TaxID=94 RepID=A0A3N1KYW6_9PROT|nr:hypothetical protein [Stella humosa]ROP84612.1 hypothetical protein EDC65_3967 [Stella humosa]BBK34132.1 hypothetical protein STHU_47660 [Stella humosa]
MRQVEAELEFDEDGGFAVSRLTDENNNDITYLVDRGARFADLADLAALLAGELGGPVELHEA